VSVFRGGFLLVDLATLLVIAAVVHPRSDLGPILGCPPLRWIGLRSYSLYLWHYPIFCVTRPGIDVPLHGWPDLALRLALSFGAAELSFRFVETPIRNGAIGRFLAGIRTTQGSSRNRAARRGALVAMTSVLTVVGLGAGLAIAQGQTPQIPGANIANAHDRGDTASASVFARLAAQSQGHQPQLGGTGGTGGSGAPGATGATGDPGGTGGTGASGGTAAIGGTGGTGVPKPVVTTPKPVGLSHEILAIGDSVMLGAKQSLEYYIPGIFVDAKVSRQFWEATAVLQQYADAHLLPPTIIVHMGTNGAFSDDQFDQMMAVIGSRRVFFINAHEPRSWETEVNVRLAADTQKYPNRLARLLEPAQELVRGRRHPPHGRGRRGLCVPHPPPPRAPALRRAQWWKIQSMSCSAR
jgi:hypothetical protein